MMVKRSLSPDCHIDSVTVQIDLAIESLSAQAIRAKGLKALELETHIIQSYFTSVLLPQPLSLVRPNAADNSGNGSAEGQELASPARLLDIGRTRNNNFFINVKVKGKTAKLFGSPVLLVKHLETSARTLHRLQSQRGCNWTFLAGP
jgi:hypothetical protein